MEEQIEVGSVGPVEAASTVPAAELNPVLDGAYIDEPDVSEPLRVVSLHTGGGGSTSPTCATVQTACAIASELRSRAVLSMLSRSSHDEW